MGNNVETLRTLGVLGDVRRRLGADSADDETFDADINRMSPKAAAEAWSGWELGDEYWAEKIIRIYNALRANQ
jgi:hypothetical protein